MSSNRASMIEGAGAHRRHPLLREAQQHIDRGMIDVLENCATFWSNYWIVNDGRAKSVNREVAESYCNAKNAIEWSPKYRTLEMTDGGRKFEEAWNDPDVPVAVKVRLGEIYSQEFARRAKGEIAVCVDNTNLPSFFRRIELPQIMANPNIRRVHRLMVAEKGSAVPYTIETLPKQQWYQKQRDQWLESTIQRFNAVADEHNTNDPLYVDTALAFLLEAETARLELDSLKSRARRLTPSREWRESVEHEERRLARCQEMLEEVPALKKFRGLQLVDTTLRELLKFEKGKLGPDSRLDTFNRR